MFWTHRTAFHYFIYSEKDRQGLYNRKMKFHITAISGTATASLAYILLEEGHSVTGSDRNFYPPMGDFVRSLPIELFQGFFRENIDRVLPLDAVIAGNYASPANPEIERAIELGLQIYSMPEALFHFAMRGKKRIVIAGTHGKTTTTSMMAWAMEVAELKPGFLIGGMPLNFKTSGRSGREWFVVEGDEYETSFFDKGPKFVHYFPNYLVLGPVEMDHFDIYGSLEEIKRNFSLLVSMVPSSGLIISFDSPINREILERARAKVVIYPSETINYKNLILRENSMSFKLKIGAHEHSFSNSHLSGSLMALNFLPVAYLLTEIGIDIPTLKRSFAEFKGIKRRMELLGEKKDLYFFTDFAHHPTALSANLKDIRKRFEGWKIIAILEPASWSMRSNLFQNVLPASLREADVTIIAPPPPGPLKKGEPLNRKALCKDLTKMHRECQVPANWEDIYKKLPDIIDGKTVVILFSNGNIKEKVDNLKLSLGL